MITAADTVARIEQLIRARSEARAWNAPKAAVLPGDGRLFMAMLAVADESGAEPGEHGSRAIGQLDVGAGQEDLVPHRHLGSSGLAKRGSFARYSTL